MIKIKLICLLLLTTITHASYYVTLKDNEFNPGKGKSILTLFVTNEDSKMKAIELTPQTRDLEMNGDEINSETEDIILIPSQVIIPPRTEKAISIRWAGSKVIQKERSYRIVINEVNIGRRQKDDTKMIKTKLRFIKSIYVAPKIIQESIRVLQANRVIANDGSSRLLLQIANNGTVHTIFHNLVLEYNTSGQKIANIKINATEINPIRESVNLLPERSIKGWIPWPETIDESVEKFNLVAYNVEEKQKKEKKSKKKSKKKRKKR